MRECKDPHRYCYKYHGLCCMECQERPECEKGCSWIYIDCFLANEVKQFSRDVQESRLVESVEQML